MFSVVEEFIGKILDIDHSPASEIPASEHDGLQIGNKSFILIRLSEIVTENTSKINRLSNEDEILTWGLRKVMETIAGSWMSPNEARNIAFVFHLNDFTNDKFGCLNGIFNIYFVDSSFGGL